MRFLLLDHSVERKLQNYLATGQSISQTCFCKGSATNHQPPYGTKYGQTTDQTNINNLFDISNEISVFGLQCIEKTSEISGDWSKLSSKSPDQTNMIKKVDFQIRLLLMDQCTNGENFRNIGRRVKASVKLVFVKEVLQIFHFLKIELQQYFE